MNIALLKADKCLFNLPRVAKNWKVNEKELKQKRYAKEMEVREEGSITIVLIWE